MRLANKMEINECVCVYILSKCLIIHQEVVTGCTFVYHLEPTKVKMVPTDVLTLENTSMPVIHLQIRSSNFIW